MNISQVAELYANANIDKMETMDMTFSRFDYCVRYTIPDMMPGVYFIYLKDGTLAYVGETGRCIKRRIARHKKSMSNPEWTGEKSGLKFHKHGLQDNDFVLKYISSDKLNLNTKHDRLTAESLFVTHLRPIVYD